MLIGEFVKNASGNMRSAVEAGEPVHVENYRKRYATVVPTELWEEAEAALLRERARPEQGVR